MAKSQRSGDCSPAEESAAAAFKKRLDAARADGDAPSARDAIEGIRGVHRAARHRRSTVAEIPPHQEAP